MAQQVFPPLPIEEPQEPSAAGSIDAELVVRSLRGESDAFAALFDRHSSRVYALAYQLVGDRGEAEDITQDAFLQALSALPTLRQPEVFGSWVARIASNAALTALRRRGRLPQAELTEAVAETHPDTARWGSPEAMNMASEEQRSVQITLNRLAPSHRTALAMREIGGLSYAEIAQAMGTSAGGVETLLFRARARFRDEYHKVALGAAPALAAVKTTCQQARQSLAALADNELPAEQHAEVVSHVRGCGACTATLQAQRDARKLLAALPVAMPATVKLATLAKVGPLLAAYGKAATVGAATATGTAGSAAAGSAATGAAVGSSTATGAAVGSSTAATGAAGSAVAGSGAAVTGTAGSAAAGTGAAVTSTAGSVAAGSVGASGATVVTSAATGTAVVSGAGSAAAGATVAGSAAAGAVVTGGTTVTVATSAATSAVVASGAVTSATVASGVATSAVVAGGTGAAVAATGAAGASTAATALGAIAATGTVAKVAAVVVASAVVAGIVANKGQTPSRHAAAPRPHVISTQTPRPAPVYPHKLLYRPPVLAQQPAVPTHRPAARTLGVRHHHTAPTQPAAAAPTDTPLAHNAGTGSIVTRAPVRHASAQPVVALTVHHVHHRLIPAPAYTAAPPVPPTIAPAATPTPAPTSAAQGVAAGQAHVNASKEQAPVITEIPDTATPTSIPTPTSTSMPTSMPTATTAPATATPTQGSTSGDGTGTTGAPSGFAPPTATTTQIPSTNSAGGGTGQVPALPLIATATSTPPGNGTTNSIVLSATTAVTPALSDPLVIATLAAGPPPDDGIATDTPTALTGADPAVTPILDQSGDTSPTAVPTDTPTDVPTDTPTNVPTDTPTAVPTDTPTDVPTDTPTDTPTDVPTDTPTDVPTDTPTDVTADTPTAVATDGGPGPDVSTATAVATDVATPVPSDTPTDVPTDTPTDTPTAVPTDTPTDTPTAVPTDTPTDIPAPTDTPTAAPIASSAGCPDISGWTCGDVGAPTLAGSQSLNNGTWTVTGGGVGPTGNADSFHYASQPFTGDGSVGAQVMPLSGWVKAGVMIRQDASPGSPYYLVAVNSHNQILVQYRLAQGDDSENVSLNPAPVSTLPVSLRISRVGDTFTATIATSADGGATWTPLVDPAATSMTIPMSPQVLGGLAVTAQDDTRTGTASFANVSISGSAQ